MIDRTLATQSSLYTSAQIRAIEASYAAQSKQGCYPLMEAAGQGLFNQLCTRWPSANRIVIFSGSGNNGGDGFVVARLAAEAKLEVTLYHFGGINKIKGDALTAFQKLAGQGIEIHHWQSLAPSKRTKLSLSSINKADVIVDAMLGIGIYGEVRAPYVDVIELINHSQRPVLAVDLPSGLDADSGTITNCAIKADVTVTFIGIKRGLLTGVAADYCGRLILEPLDIPSNCLTNLTTKLTAENWLTQKQYLPPRQASAHKGHFGHCLVIGGSNGMVGAAILAASAALRSGSGLTTAWVETSASSLLVRQPEIMAKDVPLASIEREAQNLKSSHTIIVGPGLGQSSWGRQWMALLTEFARAHSQAKVWDGDSLNWLANNPNLDQQRIMTPHPAEAGRLLGIDTAQINQNRFDAGLQIAKKYGGVCVLKGAGTIITDSQGRQVVCPVGNPGMASGGMGDLLAGIIGGLLAQKFSLFEAATLGVCIHGEAADRAAGNTNKYRGLVATDLLAHLPELLNPEI